MARSSAGPENRPQQQHENPAGSNVIGGNSNSTQRWNDVPRGTMDEVSSYVRLDLPSPDGKAVPKIVPPRLRIPYWKGLGADSEEKREPASDIDTVVVDSLKVLDPGRPIREADITMSAFNRVQTFARPYLVKTVHVQTPPTPLYRFKKSYQNFFKGDRCNAF